MVPIALAAGVVAGLVAVLGSAVKEARIAAESAATT